jgi:predicted transport protein
MSLYKTSNKLLTPFKEVPFKLEREIQNLFEANLKEIMGLEFITSEFVIKDKRLDTLAFDSELNAFVIIEFKKSYNVSVVDQVFQYLSLMLNNRADFILEYNEKMNKPLKKNDVDWSQSRVVLVSQAFTDMQKEAVNFKDFNVEMWVVKRYENNIVNITNIPKSHSAESIKTIKPKNIEPKQIEEAVTYTEDYHTKGKSDEVIELYNKFREGIMSLDSDIEIKPLKMYIAFKKNHKNVASIGFRSNNIWICVNLHVGELDDKQNLMRDVSKVGHYATGDYIANVEDDSKYEYILSIVKQAIEKI